MRVNEGRAAKGLPPLVNADGTPNPDGELTLAEYKAKHSGVVSEAAAAEQGEAVSDPSKE